MPFIYARLLIPYIIDTRYLIKQLQAVNKRIQQKSLSVQVLMRIIHKNLIVLGVLCIKRSKTLPEKSLYLKL